MQRLVLALVLATLGITASAQETHAAGFKNNAGGMTIITDRSFYCGTKGMYDGYAYASDGRTARFCWISRHDAIMAVYEDGDIRTYHIKSFELMDKEPEVKFNQP